jgi:hypothetical protein
MSSKRLFRLAYHASRSKDPRFRIHQLRDGDAFVELASVLYSRGYEYGGLFLNPPTDKPKNAPPVNISSLTALDLLVLNTRPPLHDIEEEVKRPVRPSYTRLENRIFRTLKQYFKICSRSHILLEKPIAEQLDNDYKNRANILFRESLDGSYLKYRGYGDKFWQKSEGERLTAFYLIQIPSLWKNGPGLLAAFGMAGTETLAWNYLLRTRFPKWIGSYQFLMAEVLPAKLPRKPTDLTFANEWKVTPILRLP